MMLTIDNGTFVANIDNRDNGLVKFRNWLMQVGGELCGLSYDGGLPELTRVEFKGVTTEAFEQYLTAEGL